MKFTVIIPARMHSTRLPGKPLADIGGRPMVVRVCEQALKSGCDRAVVATDHPDIVAACQACGMSAVLTSESCPTGTDRLAEAAVALGLDDGDIVVNVQGDEPLIPPEVIRQCAELLAATPQASIATACHEITDAAEFFNPNVVKVERDAAGFAMTFSRAPLPWARDDFARDRSVLPADLHPMRHIGLYAYRVGFLRAYPQLAKAPVEAAESLEQLRAMWHGYRIAVMELKAALPAGVDTPADLERVRQVFAQSH